MGTELFMVDGQVVRKIGDCQHVRFELADAAREATESLIDMTRALESVNFTFTVSNAAWRLFWPASQRWTRLRAQHIAKARGKNWRNVR